MRIGSLFSGAGGLDLAVESVFGADVAWHCEIDPAASKVLEKRWPGIPNLGDVSAINWHNWKPVLEVDILCGGFPCQDVSSAGKRAGIKDGTRSGLWTVFADAIDALRPPIVVIENVKGLLSARAHRSVEPADTDMGTGAERPILRAAGAVLGDLADLRYDAIWQVVPASAIGAPHRRDRVFILANDTHRNEPQADWPRTQLAENKDTGIPLLPTPRSSDCFGAGKHGSGGLDLRTTVAHLPTPIQWGKFAPAITRWEQLTRTAPAPTEPNRNNNPRLTATFAEWLMGWPAGWVTDPDLQLTRTDQLRIIGNGVVPQQAAAALTHLLTITNQHQGVTV